MPGKFVHRVRKQKAKARLASADNAQPLADSNATEILPSEQRKERLREELKVPGQTVSSKKKKRLEHYIDTKLRKEENLELIKKLAAQKVDTSLLRSSKNLGRGHDTRRETLSRALQESERGLNGDRNAHILYQERVDPGSDDDDEQQMVLPSNGTPQEVPRESFGSGLKRPLDLGADGLPQIKQRKRRRKAPETFLQQEEASAGDEWSGFSEDDDASVHEQPADEDAEEESLDDEDETDEESGSNSDSGSTTSTDNDRSSAFKLWAEMRRNESVGFVPTRNEVPATTTATIQYTPKPFDGITAPLAPLTGPISQKTASIVVPRSEVIQEARSKLPVVQEEQKIMETILANKITVVCGATGSGKTTQVPQMMFENGFGSSIGLSGSESPAKVAKGKIGVTQPRRVAATSVAERVKTEMGEMRNRVGHQVRFDSAVSPKTAIKFMTDGILLREITNDFALSKYSAIVIDEAHERSVNTDILIGLLSRIVDLRDDLSREQPDKHYPLKLVIMSATMRVQDFTVNQRLFRNGPPPIVEAEGRQFSVVNHFARQTHRDYEEEMFRKVSKGHRKLPKGGMLVFLTGQAEIVSLMKRLQEAFTSTRTHVAKQAQASKSEARDMESDDWDVNRPQIVAEDDDDDYIQGLSDDDDDDFKIEDEPQPEEQQAIHVLPLYSQLPADQQAKVFQPAPEGSRLIVLATNVAETSLTIPDIRYVFDCGRAKEKQYDTRTGIQTFDIGWISKASAAQRAGRAGRTGPGHCYRLYSSAVFERDFVEYTIPEILRSPIEQVALTVKSVNFPNVANFPFPTPPDRHALARAEELLKHLGAVNAAGKITDAGRRMMDYPLNPRHGRMLLFASQHNLLEHTIALVSVLTTPELLTTEPQLRSRTPEDAQRVVLKAFREAQSLLTQWDPRSDATRLLAAFGATSVPGALSQRCKEFYVREKGMAEAHALARQLLAIVSRHHPAVEASRLFPLAPADDAALAKLKFILAAGFSDQLAVREDSLALATEGRKPRRATEVPYRLLLPVPDKEKRAYIHPSSVLAPLGPSEAPLYIVYSHLSRAAPKIVSDDDDTLAKVRLHPLTPVSAKQIVGLLGDSPLFETGKPIGKIVSLGLNKREVWVPIGVRGDGVRWDLGTRKERQVRKAGEWVMDEVLA